MPKSDRRREQARLRSGTPLCNLLVACASPPVCSAQYAPHGPCARGAGIRVLPFAGVVLRANRLHAGLRPGAAWKLGWGWRCDIRCERRHH
jgi:hypothetical protein